MLLKNYSYLYDIIKMIVNETTEINTFNVETIGSRMSAKTLQLIKFIVETCNISGLKVKCNIWRYEPQGAEETFEEVMDVIENIYNIPLNRNNSNMQKRRIIFGSNIIRVRGFLTNRKSKTPKLGSARRGINTDLEINFIDEVSEFRDRKEIEMIKQAGGGAKYVINLYACNPWILSHFYVNGVNRKLAFNEQILKIRGEQLTSKNVKKRLDIVHISNHRINTYLSEAQHESLTNTWNIDENFAKVVDLGMPGVAEGLIYAPLLHLLKPDISMGTVEFGGGLDWGTSTGPNASSTALVIGRKTHDYKNLDIDYNWVHNNSKDGYWDDNKLIFKTVDKVIRYTEANYEMIKECDGINIDYDWAAFGLGAMLATELEYRAKTKKMVCDLINFRPCVKFRIPNRIDIVKMLMSQSRLYINKDKCKILLDELEGSMWDETKLVDGRPTREKINDHSLDALDYFIGSDILRFADADYIRYSKMKMIKQSKIL